MQKNTLPDWEQVLSSAARLQDIIPEAVLVGGTARIQRPVQILGSLDGIETGIRQLIRDEPLETNVINYHGKLITIPTKAEILRIKGVLILKRNATRDYLDFVALADYLGDDQVTLALENFNRLYPQDNGESPLQQLQIQLANALPFDLDEVKPELSEYKDLDPKWHDWECVKNNCANLATIIFDMDL
ncbi:hypothetical protein [Candidatus Marithrix sp. Canyon 246]|uniref:hypothetical protein n=1 Tax=Candidatus Marithrix sp. Canyon 246 TaxID=1827136 RepID=UPI000A83C0AC|nr:hypothetical protein [Candidatus Marithrix sp. Canyon 246]